MTVGDSMWVGVGVGEMGGGVCVRFPEDEQMNGWDRCYRNVQ